MKCGCKIDDDNEERLCGLCKNEVEMERREIEERIKKEKEGDNNE